MRPKTILLRLAELLSGTDNAHRYRIGYLVRKWKDRRIPMSQKGAVKEELDALRKELADQRQFKESHLQNLVAVQTEQESKDMEGTKPSEATPTSLDSRPPTAMNCWLYFREVFMVSALTGDGLAKLRVVCVCEVCVCEVCVCEVCV